METKKVLLFGGLAVGGYLLYRHMQQQQANQAAAAAAANASPGVASTLTNPLNYPQSGTTAPINTSLPQSAAFTASLYPLGDADIQQVYDRLTSAQQPGYAALVKGANPAQFSMLQSIAHSFNNNIPLTDDQKQFWSTYGTF